MGKKIDLTGQRFGKLVAVREFGKNKQGRMLWECKCDCGNYSYPLPSSLRSGNSKSCGCARVRKGTPSKNKINLAGERYGRLTVKSDTGERTASGGALWKCKCDCGNVKDIAGESLRRGLTESCGCLNIKDLTNHKFGKLTVKELSDKRIRGSAVWICDCECGNSVDVISSNLSTGRTRSCGCIRIVDRYNKRFGKLRAIELVGTKSDVGALWKCKCDCGNTVTVLSGSLGNGNVRSCGCLFHEKMVESRGSNHPRYNPYLTDEDRLFSRYELHGKNMTKWSKNILSNDSHTCQSCNKRGATLNAHHLNSWNAFPEQRFDTANGITLCSDCHKEFHHFNGYGDNTLEEFRDHIACIVGEEHVSEIEETLLSRESEIIGQEQPTHELQTT